MRRMGGVVGETRSSPPALRRRTEVPSSWVKVSMEGVSEGKSFIKLMRCSRMIHLSRWE